MNEDLKLSKICNKITGKTCNEKKLKLIPQNVIRNQPKLNCLYKSKKFYEYWRNDGINMRKNKD